MSPHNDGQREGGAAISGQSVRGKWSPPEEMGITWQNTHRCQTPTSFPGEVGPWQPPERRHLLWPEEKPRRGVTKTSSSQWLWAWAEQGSACGHRHPGAVETRGSPAHEGNALGELAVTAHRSLEKG